MNALRFEIREVRPGDAAEFSTYAYPPPFDVYDSVPGSAATFLDSAKLYVSVIDTEDNLWGFACVGKEARVPGGRYSVESDLLNVGVGMSPERIGQGSGRAFCAAIVAHASKSGARTLQVTVAAFNDASLRVWRSLGFVESHRFNRPVTDDLFIQLVSPSS